MCGPGVRPALQLRVFFRRFEAIQEVGILGESLEHFEYLIAAEACPGQPPVCRTDILPVNEETLPRGCAILSADPLFDQRYFIDVLIHLAHRALCQWRRDAVLSKIVDDAVAAELFARKPGRRVALGVSPVIQVAGLFEPRQNIVDVLGPLGSPAQLFAQLACGLRVSSQDP